MNATSDRFKLFRLGYVDQNIGMVGFIAQQCLDMYLDLPKFNPLAM